MDPHFKLDFVCAEQELNQLTRMGKSKRKQTRKGFD